MALEFLIHTTSLPVLIYIKGKLFKLMFRIVMIAWFINSDVSCKSPNYVIVTFSFTPVALIINVCVCQIP